MKKILAIAVSAAVILITVIIWGKSSTPDNINGNNTQLTKNIPVTIMASASCGCCKLYAAYLKKEGLDVNFQTTTRQDEVDRFKRDSGVPDSLRSCHTSRIGDYVIEGHVPVEAIGKLLKEKPAIKGIALPGMPSASPGMPGPKYGPFVIRTITQSGEDGGDFMQI